MQLLLSFVLYCLRRLWGLWYLVRGAQVIDRAYIAVSKGKRSPKRISSS